MSSCTIVLHKRSIAKFLKLNRATRPSSRIRLERSLDLVLMSATLNADAFPSYFGGCPVVSIPGRTHPVTEYRLEDVLLLTGYDVRSGSDYTLKTSTGNLQFPSKSKLHQLYHPKYPSSVISSQETVDEIVINYELLAALLQHIGSDSEEGAILVFLPGMAEITKATHTKEALIVAESELMPPAPVVVWIVAGCAWSVSERSGWRNLDGRGVSGGSLLMSFIICCFAMMYCELGARPCKNISACSQSV